MNKLLQTKNNNFLKVKTIMNILIWSSIVLLLVSANIESFVDKPQKYVTKEVIIKTEAAFNFDKVKQLLNDNSFGSKIISINRPTMAVHSLKLQPEIKAKKEIKETAVTVSSSTSRYTKNFSNDILNKVVYAKEGLNRSTWQNLSSSERMKYYDSYIIRFWNAAHEEYFKTGVHPLLILGRGARESQCATSNLFVATNNMFCIKWTKSLNNSKGFWGDRKYKVWSDDKIDDRFIVFNDPSEAVRAFSLFVRKNRYVKHLRWGKNNINNNSLTQWSYALCQGGFSTMCEISHDVDAGKRILERAKKLGLPMYLKDYNL